jgi:DNA-binding FadR family transcriptional regulator
MTIAEIRQALWEALHRLEAEYAVEFTRGATLYINPTNELGEDVVLRRKGDGKAVTDLNTAPYRSAADEFKL